MNLKLVSIILPVHNGARYLEDAIKSVLSQTYTNLELIIVDDKSTDNSLNIAKKYQLIDKRVKIIINEENIKLPKSLNRGFEVAQGDFLTWTSDDNVYYQDAIEEMVHSLEDNKEYDFVYADMKKIDSVGSCLGYSKSEAKHMFLYNCIGACFLYRKKCKDTVGVYDSNLFLVEDYDYWIRIAQQYQILHLSKVLYSYRFHENSLTMSKMQMVGMQLLKLKLKYFDYLYHNLQEDDKENFIFELLIYDINCLDDKSDITDIVIKVKHIIPPQRVNTCSSLYLYGAGSIGQQAIEYFSECNIRAFIDGSSQKVGKYIGGCKIISLEEIREKDVPIIITTDVRTSYNIVKKLQEFGIEKYDIFYRYL